MLQNKLKNLPKTSWIYQFFDKNWKIIYIWKSVNLKSRISSYFSEKSKLNTAKQNMIWQIKNIKTIITNNETESLILETTLIKKHLPKYNILMKDWKNHIYIKITDEIIPKIIKTRIFKKDSKSTYFWPYTNTNYINNILKIIKKIFGYRSCNIRFELCNDEKLSKINNKKNVETQFIASNNQNNIAPNNQKNTVFKNNTKNIPSKNNQNNNNKIILKSKSNTKIPCIDYHIKKCTWPCTLKEENIKRYKEQIKNIKFFLKSNNKEIIKKLTEEMKQKANELKFEEANQIKKIIENIKILQINQIVREWVKWDFDIINTLEKFNKYYLWLIKIRENKITWFYNYEISNKLKENKETIISNFIEKRYLESQNKNLVFIVPINIKKSSFLHIQKSISPFFKGSTTKWGGICHSWKNKKINIPPLPLVEGARGWGLKIENPKIWTKSKLLELCYKNIYEYAYKNYLDSLSTKWFTKKTMQNLLNIFWYKQINKNIVFECNDISHISWNHTVASRSVIENWKTNSKKYKKFKIKTLEQWKIDDCFCIKEILTRRIKEIENTWYIPDLIVIDWWKWQLNWVKSIVLEWNTKNKNFIPLPSPPPSGDGVEQKIEIKEKNKEKIKNLSEISNKQEELEEDKSKRKIKNLSEKMDKLQTNKTQINTKEIQIVAIAKREEEIFVLQKWEAIILKKDSNELRLIQKIRDEAHRFAITFNRDSRIKSMKKNILESIPWIGPKTRKKILKEFGSVENLKSFQKEKLQEKLSKSVIQNLENHGII